MQDLEKFARESAGNWTTWHWFWPVKPPQPEDWAVFALDGDGDSIEEANIQIIQAHLSCFVRYDQVRWLWDTQVAIRVYTPKRRRITAAFLEYWDIEGQLEQFPILDEDLLSGIEQRNRIGAIKDALWRAGVGADWLLVSQWLVANDIETWERLGHTVESYLESSVIYKALGMKEPE
jgi:hypothetical protein